MLPLPPVGVGVVALDLVGGGGGTPEEVGGEARVGHPRIITPGSRGWRVRRNPERPFGSVARHRHVRYVRIVEMNGACMDSPPGSPGQGSGAAAVHESRAEQAALAALIRVAKQVEVDRLSPAAIDAALRGQWRLAVRLSRPL